jgi:hypothetical protein
MSGRELKIVRIGLLFDFMDRVPPMVLDPYLTDSSVTFMSPSPKRRIFSVS